MDKIETAIIFAAKAHHNQKRKGTDIPYITHPFAVGMLLQKEKCSEEVIAAGILHDTSGRHGNHFQGFDRSVWCSRSKPRSGSI